MHAMPVSGRSSIDRSAGQHHPDQKSCSFIWRNFAVRRLCMHGTELICTNAALTISGDFKYLYPTTNLDLERQQWMLHIVLRCGVGCHIYSSVFSIDTSVGGPEGDHIARAQDYYNPTLVPRILIPHFQNIVHFNFIPSLTSGTLIKFI